MHTSRETSSPAFELLIALNKKYAYVHKIAIVIIIVKTPEAPQAK